MWKLKNIYIGETGCYVLFYYYYLHTLKRALKTQNLAFGGEDSPLFISQNLYIFSVWSFICSSVYVRLPLADYNIYWSVCLIMFSLLVLLSRMSFMVTLKLCRSSVVSLLLNFDVEIMSNITQSAVLETCAKNIALSFPTTVVMVSVCQYSSSVGLFC